MSTVIRGGLPGRGELLSGSIVPFDVTFEVAGSGRLVRAHKFLLAIHSSVFRAMVYESPKQDAYIVVEGTNYEAFQKLIHYIYQKEIDCKDLHLQELFDVVKLSERYQIANLTEDLKKQMDHFPVSKANLMEVASTATQFSCFENISQSLLLNCAAFVRRNMTSEDELQLVLSQQDDSRILVAANILRLARSLAACDNCLEKTCLAGQPVLPRKFRRGLKVRPNTEAVVYWGHGGGLNARKYFTVDGCHYGRWKLIDEDGLAKDEHKTEVTWSSNHAMNVPTFLYNCGAV